MCKLQDRPVQLKPQIVGAFDEYIREADAGMEPTLYGTNPFLWSDVSAGRAQLVRGGEVVEQSWAGQGPIKVPSGLIHDWIGAAFILATNLKKAFLRLLLMAWLVLGIVSLFYLFWLCERTAAKGRDSNAFFSPQRAEVCTGGVAEVSLISGTGAT